LLALYAKFIATQTAIKRQQAASLQVLMRHRVSHQVCELPIMKYRFLQALNAMLSSLAGGEAGSEIGSQVVKMLSSTAFDRDMDREADLAAVHMMAKADIDPEHMANFLFRLSQENKSVINLEWLNTHPNAPDRASEVLVARKKETFVPHPIMDEEEWAALQSCVESAERNNTR
jgi:predicted Zn-dependent protease